MFCKLFEVLDKIELTRKSQTGEVITSPGPTNGTFCFRQPRQLLCHRLCTRTMVLCPRPIVLLTATAMFIVIKGRARADYTAWDAEKHGFCDIHKNPGLFVSILAFSRLGAFIRLSPVSFAHANRSPALHQTFCASNSIPWSVRAGECCTADISWLLRLLRCDTRHSTEHTSLIKSPISPGCGITGLIGYCGSAPIGLSSTLLTPGVLFST